MPVPNAPDQPASRLSRRGFIHAAAGSALVAPAAVSAAAAQGAGPEIPTRAVGRPVPKMEAPEAEPLGRRLGYAVVGLGQFTLNQIIPAFAEARHSRLVALVSGNRAKAEAVAARAGIEPSNLYDYDGFDRIRDNPAIDIVYVILPNALHAEFTIRAFQAGKHVLCEKPMAPTPAECEAMIAAGRAADRRLMIAYRARFEPHNVRAIELARSGALGAIRLVTSDHHRHLDPAVPADQWRMKRVLSGGGSLVDIGVYSLQAARYMTGEEPVAVAAQIATPADDPRFREVEDMVAVQLRFPSGASAQLTSSYTSANVKRIQAFGTKATAIIDPGTEYEGNRLSVKSPAGLDEVKIKAANQFAAEMDHLSESVRSGRPVLTPGEEGLRDVRLMTAIYAAAESGRWLKLDATGSHSG